MRRSALSTFVDAPISPPYMSSTRAVTPASCRECRGLATCLATNLSTGSRPAASLPARAVFKPPRRAISSSTAATTSARPPAKAASNASPYRNRRSAWSCGARRARRRRSTRASPSAARAFCPRTKYWYDPASRRRGPFLFPRVPVPGPTASASPPRPTPSSPPRPRRERLRMLSSLFAVPTARTLASGESATESTGPGYLALCVTENPSSSCTLTCPSSEPVSRRGETRSVALLPREKPWNTSFSSTGGGPPSGATCAHITVFWWHRIFRSSFPPESASQTHTSCPPTETSIAPPGSHCTSSTGAPCLSVMPHPPLPPFTRESHNLTVPS
mmetsp:Transcript_1646/g.6560  ORF Transcript_1646/g.6560 Transcript_1646/m.6560 type:complete len:331 (+) Transcript_1646:1186-2178(+)